MRLNSARVKRLVVASALAGLWAMSVALSGQGRGFGGGGTSTSRVASPTVVASWMSHENYADGKATTLLVLWRGTPGWFSKGGGASSGGGSGGGGGGSTGYQHVSEGGLTFMMEFDYDKRIVKMLKQEISLDAANVVLVDFVDSPSGPTIAGQRWVDPLPPGQVSAIDSIAAVIKRSPELFEYLRCDITLSDPLMKRMMPIICGQMRSDEHHDADGRAAAVGVDVMLAHDHQRANHQGPARPNTTIALPAAIATNWRPPA